MTDPTLSKDTQPQAAKTRPSSETGQGAAAPAAPAASAASASRDEVPPGRVNRGDHGTADDNPAAGGALNFDDDALEQPRGKTERQGGTWQAEGADSGKLGRPAEILSDRNAPSDPAARRGDRAPR